MPCTLWASIKTGIHDGKTIQMIINEQLLKLVDKMSLEQSETSRRGGALALCFDDD
jgi:hypothetical protein